MKKEDISISEQLKEFFKSKIEQGYEVKDKSTFGQLRKMGMDEFKLQGGWRGNAKKILEDVLKDLNLQVEDLKKPEGIKAQLIKEEIQQTQQITQQSPHGTLPKSESIHEEQIQQPTKPQLTESDKAAYETMFRTGFNFLTDIYVKFGIIEVKDFDIKEKMTLEQYQNDTDKLAVAWSDYCYRNNIHLPKYIELIILCIATAAVFGMPIVNILVFGKKSKPKEQDEKLNDIGEK